MGLSDSEIYKGNAKKFINPNIFSSNFYVINYNDTVIVIDPGFYDWEFKEYLNKLWKVDSILLTHGHWDHIRCVDKIVGDYPKAKVFIHPFDKGLLSNIQLNCSFLIWNEEIKVKSDTILVLAWTKSCLNIFSLFKYSNLFSFSIFSLISL